MEKAKAKAKAKAFRKAIAKKNKGVSVDDFEN
jgi:hypothetical protein